MTDTTELPAGQCVCGRPLPDEPLSDWACSEVCQSAWQMHQVDPSYPTPKQIRDAAEARIAQIRRTVPDRVERIPDGCEIDVDGDRYVREDGRWVPAGMWSPLRTDLAQAVQYQRWCPTCRRRRLAVILDGPRQVCDGCQREWQGPPLVGVVESRGEPWPGLRLRLSDGSRSIAVTFTEQEVTAAGPAMADRIDRCWLRMERQLCGGYADVDQPSERQLALAGRRLSRTWRWHASVERERSGRLPGEQP